MNSAPHTSAHYEVRPASNEHDSEVTGLFNHLGLEVDPAYWTRAYSPEQDAAYVARPYILWSHHNGVVGFAALRPRTLVMGKERMKAQMLFDFILHPSEVQNKGPEIFLRELVSKAEITFSAGTGLEATRLLERERFLRAGVMDRFVFDPAVDQLDIPSKSINPLQQVTTIPGNVQNMMSQMQQDGTFHFDRNRAWMEWMHLGVAAGSREILMREDNENLKILIISRTVQGHEKKEMQITDAFCHEDNVVEMGHALAARAIHRKMPVYLSFFGGRWGNDLRRAGFRQLRGRWPIHWTISDPKQRSLVNVLLRKEQWHFFAVDGEIDHY